MWPANRISISREIPMASITKLAPQILAGSAVVGFGFAFGRDIYRETKRHWVFVLIFVVLASCLYGLFISSVWMARNYRTWFESFAKRLGAFSIFMVCYFLLFSATFLLVEIASGTNGEKEKTIVQSTSLWEVHADSLVDGSPLSAGFLVQTLIGIGGLILGFTQRHKRRLVWQAEDSNATFVPNMACSYWMMRVCATPRVTVLNWQTTFVMSMR